MDEKLIQIFQNVASKVDWFLIGKTFVEVILFVIVLKFVNKALHVFFDKLINRLSDSEAQKTYLFRLL